MSLSFANAAGNLFNRLGKYGLLIKQQKSYQTSQLANMTDTTNGVVAQLNAESDIQAIMGSAYIGLLGDGGYGGVAQALAQATVNRMVFRDNPRLNQNLTTSSTLASLNEVIRQMKLAGASVLAMTVAATPQAAVGAPGPYFTGTGNGIPTASVKRPFDGLTLENAYAESLLYTCTADSYSGGTTAGNESFQVTGVGSEGDYFAFDWPLGSNSTAGISAINATADNGEGNLLTNSAFDDFTSNVPDNWELAVGTAGVDIFEEDTLVYDTPPNKAVRILGDGATLVSIRQLFGDSTGTVGSLDPQTQYSFCIFLRRDGVAPGAGVLQIDLADDAGTVIQDEAGTNNQVQVTLSGLTVFYAPYTVSFRTPAILPDDVYLRIHLTTALTAGRSIYLDFASLGVMQQMYTSGPFVAVHAGAIPFQIDDYAYVAVTNSRGAAGTLSTFQTLLAQLFPNEVYGSELLFPSSAVPTISDSLIA